MVYYSESGDGRSPRAQNVSVRARIGPGPRRPDGLEGGASLISEHRGAARSAEASSRLPSRRALTERGVRQMLVFRSECSR